MIQLRQDLAGERPYGAPQLSVPIVLNVNENPYPATDQIAAEMGEAVRQAALGMNRYPDREAQQLRAALARYLGHGLSADQVWAANGSNEIMAQLLTAFGGPGRTVLTFTPTYSMYPEYARNTLTGYVTAPRRADASLDADLVLAALAQHQPQIVVITRPNNPTGTSCSLEVIRAVAENFAGLLIVDEAYQEFSTQPSALELIAEFEHVVVTRTMSKAFSLAGGRVGYLAASQEIVNACRIVRLPYHLSAQTQAVALVALQHQHHMLSQVAELAHETQAFAAWLTEQGYAVFPTDANFVLFGRFDDPHQVWQDLLDRGILIREVGPPGYLRASAGTPAEMAALRSALADLNPTRETA